MPALEICSYHRLFCYCSLQVCHEAALGPIREVSAARLKTIKAEEVRPMKLADFIGAVEVIRPSVSNGNIEQFQKWSDQYGVSR
jgi:SpoVK/Ycf46/Vps4 family AAA+-type ATPase